MKILFVCPNYLPVLGGIQNSTHNLAKQLIKKGFEISVVCEKREFKEFEIIDNVKVYRYERKSLPKILKSFSMGHREKTFAKFIKKFLEKKDFDVIIPRFPFFVRPLKKIAPKTPIIYIQPSIAYISLKYSSKFIKGLMNKFNQSLRSKNMFSIEKEAVQKADVVIPRSKAMNWINKNTFKANKNISKITIGSGIDKNRFKKTLKDKKLLKEFNLQNKKIVLTVSRLTPDKNIKGLIETFEKVKDKKTCLLIVGGGPEEERLRRLVIKKNLQESIILTGSRKDPEKFYNLADIFVLTSKQEGFGNVFLEALATGVPIIGFKAKPPKIITAVEDIIGKSKSGFAVEDEKAIMEKISYLLKNKKTLDQFKRNALKRSKDFSWEEEANKLEKEIKRIIKK